jgi:hypothetical protein
MCPAGPPHPPVLLQNEEHMQEKLQVLNEGVGCEQSVAALGVPPEKLMNFAARQVPA